MKPRDVKQWITVARDIVFLGLGVFILVFTLIGDTPPKPGMVAAGLALLYGGRKTVSEIVKNGGKNGT